MRAGSFSNNKGATVSDQSEAHHGEGEPAVKTINPGILDKLSQFEAHTRRNETCMACGYVGIMGIGDEIRPWWLSWWFIAVIAIVGSIFMGAGLVIGGGLIALRYFGDFDSMVLVCPSCDAEFVDD